jgi:glycine dehydrogenase
MLNLCEQFKPCSWPEFNSIHPFVPKEQAKGYQQMMDELASDLCEITGYDKISFQPNRLGPILPKIIPFY